MLWHKGNRFANAIRGLNDGYADQRAIRPIGESIAPAASPPKQRPPTA